MKDFTAKEQEIISTANNIILSRFKKYPLLNSPKLIRKYLVSKLVMEENTFRILLLNEAFCLIDDVPLTLGTIDISSVYARDVMGEILQKYAKAVMKIVIEHNASAILMVHNHPQGFVYPSNADKEITTQITAALGLVGVRVIDHVILAGDKTYSFSEHGILGAK